MSEPVTYEMYQRGDVWVVAQVAGELRTPIYQHRAKYKAQAVLDRYQPTITESEEDSHG